LWPELTDHQTFIDVFLRQHAFTHACYAWVACPFTGKRWCSSIAPVRLCALVRRVAGHKLRHSRGHALALNCERPLRTCSRTCDELLLLTACLKLRPSSLACFSLFPQFGDGLLKSPRVEATFVLAGGRVLVGMNVCPEAGQRGASFLKSWRRLAERGQKSPTFLFAGWYGMCTWRGLPNQAVSPRVLSSVPMWRARVRCFGLRIGGARSCALLWVVVMTACFGTLPHPLCALDCC
jgi:hypothetical protein